MIYFFNAQGTTVGVKSSAVYQGSTLKNGLVAVTPFASNIVPTVAFTLPNGLSVMGGMMKPINFLEELQGSNGELFNVWAIDLDFPITQFAGTVSVQFTFMTGQDVIKSYTTQFLVERGVPNGEFPPFNEITNDAEKLYNDIVNYLSSIGGNLNEALENGIAYVRYTSSDLLNGADSGCLLFAVNGNQIISSNQEIIPSITNGDFTVASMTEYLTENQIKNPNLDGNKDENFFQYNTGSNPPSSPAGFIIAFPFSKDVGILQLYIYNVIYNGNLQITTNYGTGESETVNVPLTRLEYITENDNLPNEMQIIRVPINKSNVAQIKVVQTSGVVNGAYICKGVEVFGLSIDGYYEIVENSGNVMRIDTYNGDTLKAQIEAIKDQAQTYSNNAYTSEINAEKWAIGTSDNQDPQYNNSAKDWAESITDLAGKVGGYPILQNIGGEPKIPTVYIQQVDIKEYIMINSEEDLDTVEAQIGDVALLTAIVNGERTVIKSWLLVNIFGDRRVWVVYGTSYATNSGNAVYAESSGNASTINGVSVRQMTQAEYNEPTTNKNGIVFVTID